MGCTILASFYYIEFFNSNRRKGEVRRGRNCLGDRWLSKRRAIRRKREGKDSRPVIARKGRSVKEKRGSRKKRRSYTRENVLSINGRH